HAGPNLNEALEEQIHGAAVKPLHRAGCDPDDGGYGGESEAEQNRYTKAVDDAGQDIPALVVGAEQVSPIRWRWRWGGQILHAGIVAEGNSRPDHPAFGVYRLLHVRVGIIGFGGQKIGAKCVFAVIEEYWEIPFSVI